MWLYVTFPLFLVLHVIIVKSFEVRIGNGLREEPGYFFWARSTLILHFMAFVSLDKFPESPPGSSSCIQARATCMCAWHPHVPRDPPRVYSGYLLYPSLTISSGELPY